MSENNEKLDNELIFTQERNVSSAFIDSSLKMGIAQTVLMAQDNLTECFSKLGCDGVVYREKYHVFWVFTKSKLHFAKRPLWREKIQVSTFPVDNAGFKAHINSIFKSREGQTLVRANQEACVLDMDKHRPVKLTNLDYPKENFPRAIFDDAFEKFDSDFGEEDFKYQETIRSQHIDMSGHMNNIEYIKLALNVFTDDFLLSHEPQNLEVHYTGESKEGQSLRIYAKEKENATLVCIKEDKRRVFEMKIDFYS